MSKELRPLLAAKIDHVDQLELLPYPMLVSPKLDGIRLRIDPILGGVSRTHKPIPNAHIQSLIAQNSLAMQYLDGEVIIGEPTASDVFNKTQSAVMTYSGSPPFSYYIFDDWREPDKPYSQRYEYVKVALGCGIDPKVDLHLVPQNLCFKPIDVLEWEERYLQMGYEGIIIRSPNGRYKNGRSTFKEAILLKFKRIQDAEAVIVGFEELLHNQNPLNRDDFGLAKRQSLKEGMVKSGILGAITVEHTQFGQFSIGSGFDQSTRAEIWANQDKYMGKTVTFVYQPVGMKDKPRFPIFKGIRHD